MLEDVETLDTSLSSRRSSFYRPKQLQFISHNRRSSIADPLPGDLVKPGSGDSAKPDDNAANSEAIASDDDSDAQTPPLSSHAVAMRRGSSLRNLVSPEEAEAEIEAEPSNMALKDAVALLNLYPSVPASSLPLVESPSHSRTKYPAPIAIDDTSRRSSPKSSRLPSMSTSPVRSNTAAVIQAKRRQASAPFHSLASGHDDSLAPLQPLSAASSSLPSSNRDKTSRPQRTRSRQASRTSMTPGALTSRLSFHALSTSEDDAPSYFPPLSATTANGGSPILSDHNPTNGWTDEADKAMDGLADVVFTPTTEEWSYMGGKDVGAGHRLRFASRSRKSSHASLKSAPSFASLRRTPSSASIAAPEESSESDSSLSDEESASPAELAGSSSQSTGGSSMQLDDVQTRPQRRQTLHDEATDAQDSIDPHDSGSHSPSEDRSMDLDDRNIISTPRRGPLAALSGQSLSKPSSSELFGLRGYSPKLANAPLAPFSGRLNEPVPLARTGPVDPRSYSSRTGARSIKSFEIQGEAGKGAYGTVCMAREKGPDGIAVDVCSSLLLSSCP